MSNITAQDIRPFGQYAATPGQFQLISDMAKERGIDITKRFNRPETREDAKVIIAWLKALPVGADKATLRAAMEAGTAFAPAFTQPAQPSAPQAVSYDGIAPAAKPGKRAQAYHYAIEVDGVVKFYRVKAGRKKGFYFVDAQASDDYYPVKNFAHKHAILDAINADRDGALALYGREVGRCGRCNRTLTSEYRKLGIGPVCIDK